VHGFGTKVYRSLRHLACGPPKIMPEEHGHIYTLHFKFEDMLCAAKQNLKSGLLGVGCSNPFSAFNIGK
jgi:hypothetical protein